MQPMCNSLMIKILSGNCDYTNAIYFSFSYLTLTLTPSACLWIEIIWIQAIGFVNFIQHIANVPNLLIAIHILLIISHEN
jgi:hypothetical protein